MIGWLTYGARWTLVAVFVPFVASALAPVGRHRQPKWLLRFGSWIVRFLFAACGGGLCGACLGHSILFDHRIKNAVLSSLPCAQIRWSQNYFDLRTIVEDEAALARPENKTALFLLEPHGVLPLSIVGFDGACKT